MALFSRWVSCKRNQAPGTRSPTISGTTTAVNGGSFLKNWTNCPNCLPPTAPCTTCRALPPTPINSRRVLSLPLHALRKPVAVKRRNQCRLPIALQTSFSFSMVPPSGVPHKERPERRHAFTAIHRITFTAIHHPRCHGEFWFTKRQESVGTTIVALPI